MVRKFFIFLIFLSATLYGYEVGDLRIVTSSWVNNGITAEHNRVYRIQNKTSSGSVKFTDSEGVSVWASSNQVTNRTEDYNPLIEIVESFSFVSGVSLFLIFSKGFNFSFGI